LDLAAECEEAGTRFIAYLKTLTSNSSSKLVRTVKTAVKFHWSSHEIDDFVAKLEKLHGSLTLATVLAFRTSSESSNDEILTHLKAIQQDNKARDSDETDIQTALQILVNAVQDQASDRLGVVQHEIQLCLKEINGLRSEFSQEQGLQGRESEILRWLDFRQIFWRYESVATAYGKTYEWIYDSPITHNNWSDFSLHLQQDRSEPYFISGKAGSGKSTLMKFIYDNPKTQTALKKWAGASELMNLHFFFWDLGTTLQKTHVGMLRALLHMVLERHPELIPAVFPRLYRNWKESDADIEPQYVEMKEAFEKLMEKSRFLKLAILIDGIDEFGGDHRDMALFLRSLASPQVKLIVSSRPLNACLDALAGCPTLRLQELTRSDMEKLVRGELSSNRLMARLMQQFPTRGPQLIVDLLDKAEGVFLWVILVLRLLIDGLENGDNLEELHAKLTSLPSDLRDLYKNMFGKMRIEHQQDAAVIFQLLDRWNRSLHEPLPGVILSYAICPPTDVFEAPIVPITAETFDWTMDTLEKRIRSRCCGLLELRDNEETRRRRSAATNSAQFITINEMERDEVTYLHRTVAEFIATPEIWQDVCELTNEISFESASSLASACLSIMKLAGYFDDDGLQWYLQCAARFCRQATSTDPQVIQKYVYEMDRIMSELQKKSLPPCDHQPHDSTLHWSAKYFHEGTDTLGLAVEKHASIHTFAASHGLLAYLRSLHFDADHDERFIIVLNALYIWENRVYSIDLNSITLDEASETLSYLLRNVAGPESMAFDTSLWQQALLWCTDMDKGFSILEAARLLKILLGAASSPQSLWQNSVKDWKSMSTSPTQVMDSFRAFTKARPSQESSDLLHDLERLTGTKDNQSVNAGANRKGSSLQTNRSNRKKSRRKKKVKLRAKDGTS
jgi:hypothetical protein